MTLGGNTMRIAVLSDIHSNVFALEAVINDAKQRGAEKMFNLGDIVYGPVAPKATYALLNPDSASVKPYSKNLAVRGKNIPR